MKDFKAEMKKFLDAWGARAQIMMCIEEMSELSQAFCKYFRMNEQEGKYSAERKQKNLDNVREEIADVLNMALQMRMHFGEKEIDQIMQQKIERCMGFLPTNFENLPIYRNFTDAEIGKLKKIVIAIHGYSSSKESGAIVALAQRLKKHGMGLIAFDLPLHGKNETRLLVENCLECISQVENYVRANFKCPVSLYGSSFGAYLVLVHLIGNAKKYADVVLRVPAIDCYKSFVKHGYKGDPEFLSGMKACDVFANVDKIKGPLNIVYGANDTVVDNEDIFRLAKLVPCNLFEIKNAGHRSSDALDEIADTMLKIYLGGGVKVK